MKRLIVFVIVLIVVVAGGDVIYYGVAGGPAPAGESEEEKQDKKGTKVKEKKHTKVSLSQVPPIAASNKDRDKFLHWLIRGDLKRIEALVELCAEEGTDDQKWALCGDISSVIADIRSLERRRKLIELLLKALLDQRYSSRHDYIEEMGFERHLRVLYEEDFTPKAENTLAKIIERRGLTYTRVMLTGIADMERYYSRYRKMARRHLNGEKDGDVSWAALLVMARRGKEEAREKFARGACREVKEEELVWVTDLLRDLAYTRHPAAIRCIGEYLNSDEEIGSGGRGMRRQEINIYAGSALLSTMKNYPITDKDRPWEERLPEVRDWMNTHSGEWEFYTSASQWPKGWTDSEAD